jgi:hypothetical protein
MWQFALWGLAGAATNRAIIFLEASNRAKERPWRYPEGPGAWSYAISVVLHCCIGAVVTFAAAESGYIHNALLGLGLGASATVAMKAISRMSLAALPAARGAGSGEDPGDSGEGPSREGDSS